MLFMLLFAIKRQNYSFFLYCQNLYITLCSKNIHLHYSCEHIMLIMLVVANGVKHNSIYIQ